MTTEEMQAIVADVDFPEYTLVVREDGRGATYLQGSYLEDDVDTGEPETQVTRRWFLTPMMTKSEIVQTAFKLVMTSAEHRVREAFQYKGQRVFGPHFNIDDLVEMCRQKKADHRQGN